MSAATLYRWALLDAKGKNRGTCTAVNWKQARQVFLRARKGVPIPGSWSIARRDAVKGYTVTDPIPALPPTEARVWAFEDFKVGDVIRITAKHWATRAYPVKPVALARLVDVKTPGLSFTTDLKITEGGSTHALSFSPCDYTEEEVEKVVEPSTEELLARAIAQSTDLAGQLQEALGLPGASWPEIVRQVQAAKRARDEHRTMLGLPLDVESKQTITEAIHVLQAIPEGMTAQLREALGIHRDTWPAMVEAARGVASQMDRFRLERDEWKTEALRYAKHLKEAKAERDQAQARMADAQSDLARVRMAAQATAKDYEAVEAKLADARAIVRTIQIVGPDGKFLEELQEALQNALA